VLTRLVRTVTRLDLPVDRVTYLVAGLVLAVVKFLGDVALIRLAGLHPWSPWDYLAIGPALLAARGSGPPSWFFVALGCWALPFLWLGSTLTIRRLVDADHSPWWSALFLIPWANYALILALILLPSVETRPTERQDHNRPTAITAITAIAGGLGVGLAMVLLSITALGAYGTPLFIGTPLAMGAGTGFLYNRRTQASLLDTFSVACLGILLTAGTIFLFAMEGAVCLLMALPIALPIAMMGALLGRMIAQSGQERVGPAAAALLVLPISVLLDTHSGPPVIHEVRSAIEIDAPPDRVWSNVIAFPPITEPLDLVFQLGVAYPRSAHIEGSGIGATRYCEFSTGAFVEPITRWEPGQRLSFDVARAPLPMTELSIYSNVRPRHLDGYLQPVRGEFRLIPLPGGRTRLEGSTWYTLRVFPEGYWSVFGDALIGRIHHRVLAHIQSASVSGWQLQTRFRSP
jgi:uncharacterized membrane protein YhaH (DUF805 family)